MPTITGINGQTINVTEEQKQQYDMGQEMNRQQAAGQQMNLLLQHQAEEQKERFATLSNIMKAGSESISNIDNNIK